MGLSSSKSSTSSNTTANSTTTPTVAPWLSSGYEQLAGAAQGLMNTNPSSYTTGTNAALNTAYGGAANLGQPNGAVGQATSATSGLLSNAPITFNPVSANPITASKIAGVNPVSAGSIGASPVSVGMLKDVDLSSYMNPYLDSVVSSGVNDLDQARQRALVGNSASSAAGGGNAWNGDRAGVADSETNRGFLDQVSSLTANLRNQGFLNAQNAALQDISNKYGADTFNSGQSIDVQRYNSDASYRAAVDNAQRALSTQQYNAGAQQSADAYNSSQALDAAKFNSTGQYGAASDDAARKLAAATSLFNFGVGSDANNRANLTTAGQLGESQRQVESETNPQIAYLKQLAAIQALLQGIPINAYTSQTTNSSGTSNGTTTSTPSLMQSATGLLGGLGGLFGGLGLLGKSSAATAMPGFPG